MTLNFKLLGLRLCAAAMLSLALFMGTSETQANMLDSQTCTQAKNVAINYCVATFVGGDLACCMSRVACIMDAEMDFCDCEYTLGSPQFQACYAAATAKQKAGRKACLNGAFGNL